MTVPAQPGLATAIESPNVVISDSTNGAQSPAPSPAAFQHGATGERVFSEADIAKARKEEKDKLYSQLESLKTEMKTLQEERAAELAAAEQKKREKESKLKAEKEAEMSAKDLLEAKLKETNDTWENRFTQLQQEREQERALLAKEREYNELVDYRNSQLQANANDIAPQFHSFIVGNNKEQIDNAIAQAKAATKSILDEIAAERQQHQSQMRGVSPTGYTALGPLEGSMNQKTYSPDDINNMSMAEYAKFRTESGLAGRDAQRNAGLFG